MKCGGNWDWHTLWIERLEQKKCENEIELMRKDKIKILKNLNKEK